MGYLMKTSEFIKSASRWTKLWRAGKLGENSLQRLGMQGAAVPKPPAVGYRDLQNTYRTQAAANMPRSFASKGPNHNWAPSGINLGAREFNEPGLMTMQATRRSARRPSYTGMSTQVRSSAVSPSTFTPPSGDRAYNTVSVAPHQTAPLSRPELYTRGRQVGWSEAGGVSSYGIARANNTTFTSSNKLPWVRPKARYSGHEGTVAHEMGHLQQAADPYSGMMTNLINRRLLPTLPQGRLIQPGTPQIDELAGHFNATRGMSFGNRAALKLPIYNAQNLSPGLPAQWKDTLRKANPRMSEGLLQKLVSTRSHMYSNYGVM